MSEPTFWQKALEQTAALSKTTKRPGGKQSAAWRNSIFDSGERREAARSSTRFKVRVTWQNRETMVSGGHERAAALLLDHLWAVGLISRWKPQPLCMSEIGGSSAVPDFLAELRRPPGTLHLIQVKAARFLTQEVNEEFDGQRLVAQSNGMGFHVWTNANVLGGKTLHTLNNLDRGSRNSPVPERIEEIRVAAQQCKTLGELLDRFDWDDVEAAAASFAYFIDVTKSMDRNSPIRTTAAPQLYEHLFMGRSSPTSFWKSLAPVSAAELCARP